MTALKRILVPTDFSDASRAALELAVRVAGPLSARITVLHAATSPTWVSPSTALQLAEGKASITVEALAKRDAGDRLGPFVESVDAGDVEVRTHFLFDDPLDGILREAHGADLIVMGTHGRRGLDRLLLGSLAEKVVRSADRPVITQPPAPSGPPEHIRRVLVPVDFSNGSRAALELAAHFRDHFGAKIDLLHVVQHVPAVEGAELLVVPFEGDTKEPFEEFARRRAAREMTVFLSETPGHEQAEVRVELGDPGRTVVRVAEDGGYDLIAMGTHGRSGFRRFVMGSVAERVVRESRCPVLTVREAEVEEEED